MSFYTKQVPGLANFPLSRKGNVDVSIQQSPTFKSQYLVKAKSGLLGTTTGKIAVSTDDLRFFLWVEVKYGVDSTGWVWYTEYAINPVKELQKIWISKDAILKNFSAEVRQAVAQAYVDRIVETDKKIFLLCLQNIKVMRTMQTKGISTTNIESQLVKVVKRYNDRQAYMRKNMNATVGNWDMVKNIFADAASWVGISGTQPRVNYLAPQPVNGLGILPLIIIGAIVSAILLAGGYALNNWLQPKYSESEADLDVSTDLDKALKTLSPETRQEVVNNLEKQIDTAYNQGKKDQKKDDGFDITKYAGLFIGGILFMTVGLPALQRLGQGQRREQSY